MCLAIPLKLTEIDADTATGTVDLDGGGTMKVGLDIVPDAVVGEYVLVHAGMAIETLSEADAAPILEAIAEYVEARDMIEPGPIQ